MGCAHVRNCAGDAQKCVSVPQLNYCRQIAFGKFHLTVRGLATLKAILECRWVSQPCRRQRLVYTCFRTRRRPAEAPGIVPSLCPGRKGGVAAVFGLGSDRKGATVSPVFLAFGWIGGAPASGKAER